MRLSVETKFITDTFFCLEYEDDSPDRWRHFEEQPYDGGEPVEFELY